MDARQIEDLSKRLDKAKYLQKLIAEMETAVEIAKDDRWKDSITFHVQYHRQGHGSASFPIGILGRDFIRSIIAAELSAARTLLDQMEGA